MPASSRTAPEGAKELDAELALIATAQAALGANDPRAAIAALNDHASRYPNGQFSQEREGLRIVAACSLGAAGASAKAATFLRARPKSPLAARIHDACDRK
jgi:hypothetical protein